MRKIIIILLALMPILANAQENESINYWDNRPPKSSFKTPGSQLKAAGTAFFFSTAFFAVGTIVSYTGYNNLAKDYAGINKYSDFDNLETNIIFTQDDIDDMVKRTRTINTVTYITYGAGTLSALIAFGKLISAGNLMEEQRRQDAKKTSLNITGSGLSLTYRF